MKAEQARRWVDTAIGQLAEALERGQSNAMKAYLAAMGRFHRYSLHNALLIALARPGATRVAGFHTWKRLGRHVRRGERGIAILAPIVRRAVRKPSRRSLADEDEPEAVARRQEDVFGFRAAYVFDVSQTEGKPLPAFATVRGNPGPYLERLKTLVAARGVGLTCTARIAPAYGAAARGEIMLLPGLPPAEEFSTLAHELAHTMLHEHSGAESRSKTVRETEAEAVAHVVSEAAGLDTNSAAADYIALYDGSKETLLASLERIHSAASEIIRGILDTSPARSRLEGDGKTALTEVSSACARRRTT